MNQAYEQLVDFFGKERVLVDEPLSKYTSLHLGGNAKYLIKVKTSTELIEVIKITYRTRFPFFLLGGGTNTLVSENGFHGLVIKNETNSIKFIGMRGERMHTHLSNTMQIRSAFLEVDGGVSINRLVRFTLDQGLAGLQAFLGQPGTVGGALFINAHNMYKGVFFGDTVQTATILTPTGEIKEVPQSYFRFGYDKSILQKTKEIAISIKMQLTGADKDTLWNQAQDVQNHRKVTQPQGVFSAGCIFRNILTSNRKLSAGTLLDKAGLKGVQIGGAQFSTHHANFIIHTGEATAHDVLELMELAKKRVKKQFGISLSEEVVRL